MIRKFFVCLVCLIFAIFCAILQCEEELPKIVSAVISFLESLADARLCTGMGVCQPSSLRELFLREKEVTLPHSYPTEYSHSQ